MNKKTMPQNPSGLSLAIVLVTYGHKADLKPTLDAISRQKQKGDFVVLVDNHPKHKSAEFVRKYKAVDKIMMSDNVGFSGGCNLAAANIPKGIGLILLLNPDATPCEGALMAIRNGRSEWDAWMGLLIMPNQKINSAGNIVHVSGLSWCGLFGGKPEICKSASEVVGASGACMAIRRGVWDSLGGFGESFFMYYEDTDLSMRIHLAGRGVGIIPGAKFIHDYDYKKSSYKWFYMERNRYIFIVRTWPAAVVVVLLPLMLAIEIGLWVVSIMEKRFILRWRSVISFALLFPGILRQRRGIQSSKVISSRAFFRLITPDISTPLLGKWGSNRLLKAFMRGYYRVAMALLKA